MAHKHGTMIVHDLAYADLCFDGYEAPSLLQVPGAKEVGVEIFSRCRRATTWRAGRVGCLPGQPENDWCAGAASRATSTTACFRPIQIASIIALRECEEETEKICAVYEKRRDVLIAGLHRAGWMVEPPQATMFVWAKIPERYEWAGSLEFSKLVHGKGTGSGVSGDWFRAEGEGYVRFALVENEHRTRQATRGIKKLLQD